MLEANVEEVHNSLGLTAVDFDTLKRVKRIWTQAENLRRLAENGDKGKLKAYKEFLGKCLGQVRSMQTIEDIDELQKLSLEYNTFYLAEVERLNIVQHESGRWPQGHQEWVERHLPEVYSNFTGSVARWCEAPSQQSFDNMKASTTEMLQAYVAAVPHR